MGIDLNKCHLGSDGASTFSRRLAGVAALLKKDYPLMQWIHCVAHREALAASDSIQDVEYLKKTVEPAIGGVYRHFSNSGIREASLHQMQVVLEDPRIKLKEPSSVRWLSHASAVEAFRKSFASIIVELDRESTERHDMAASGWLKKIQTFKFAASLLLLSDVLPILVRLSKKFQVRSLAYSDIKPALVAADTSLQQLLVEDGEHLSNVKEFVTSAAKKGVKLFISGNCENLQQAVDAFKKSVGHPYIKALQKALANRFPSLPVIDALSIFQPNLCRKVKPEDLAFYGNEKASTLMSTLTGFIDEDPETIRYNSEDSSAKSCKLFVDSLATRQEWRPLKSLMYTNSSPASSSTHSDSDSGSSVSNFIQMLYSTGNAQDLPNLMFITNWGLAIPMSSVECERDFS